MSNTTREELAERAEIAAHEYSAPVTRIEVFSVSERTLQLERIFQQGRADRKAGRPCKSANGAYLNGWYAPETAHYYVTAHAAHLV